MKTIYQLFYALLFTVVTSFSVSAQCSLTEPAVELNYVSPIGGNCTVNLNLSFTIDRNNGNKYTYVHLWAPGSYPNIDYKKAPTATDLGAVLATLAISTNGTATLLATYTADPSNVIPLSAGLVITEEDLGSDISRITIDNIQFEVPGACETLPILKGDVWSTQAQSKNPPVHCFSEGFNLSINDPLASGVINCNDPDGPRTYDLDITTTNPIAFQIEYKLYLDDGVLTGGNATFTSDDQLIYTSPPTSLSSLLPVNSKDEPYTYGNFEDKRSIWVVVTGISLPNAIVAELKNNCTTTLPVKLAKFSGDLLDDAVTLSWITTEEEGSSYFDVERSADLSEFITLGRIQSQGTTSATQRYNFLDKSPIKGNNYYRLKMVDLNGSSEHSRIISVANNSNSVAFELLGNPVVNREIKFVLKNERIETARLYDLNGRQVNFKLNQSGNTYTIKPNSNIPTGLYILSLGSEEGVQTKKVLVP
jgi:hypothetical protein